VFYDWTSSQRINVEGYASRQSADNAWGSDWRGGCNARIYYKNGDTWVL